MGPIQPGITKFVLQVIFKFFDVVSLPQADPPNINNIPEEDVIGATAILLTGAYRERVFFQVGYIVHNDLDEAETKLDPSKITRNVMAEHPRVTLYANGWDNPDWVDFTRPQEPNLHTGILGTNFFSDPRIEDVMETEAEGEGEGSGSGDSELSEEEDSVSDESVLSDPGEEMEDNEPQKPFKFTR